MNLSDYIGSEIKKVKRKKLSKEKDEDEKKLVWNKDAKHWCRMFLKIKSDRTGTFIPGIPTSARIYSVFHHLLQAVSAYEKRTQTKVSAATYLRAHFSWYGNELYANQLLSDISWDLYRTFERIENTPYYKEVLGDITADAIMLRRLSEIRQEPESIILLSLKHSGLFSRKFLKSRGIK